MNRVKVKVKERKDGREKIVEGLNSGLG